MPPSSFTLSFAGQAATDLSTAMVEIQIEENVELPGAFSIKLPLNVTQSGDYDLVVDSRMAPLTNVTLVATAADGQAQCLIDGYLLAQTVHLDTGTSSSTIEIWGQDASWLMNTTEQAKEWADVTDSQVAASIFGNYGITPDSANSDDDSPAYTSDTNTLMQRGTDAQFLRRLAKRTGKIFRVFCTDTPGQRTGTFARPSTSGDPATTLTLNDMNAATVNALDISWDVMRPTATIAMQELVASPDSTGAGGTTSDSGIDPMEAQSLAQFTGTTVTSLLTATVDSAQELTMRAQSVLTEAGWFVRCKGTADVGRLGSILRAGTVAQLTTAGSLHSGNYYVWSVRHKITSQQHTMDFVLVRNAMGAASGGSSLPGGVSL
jgi:phage protein D